MNPETIQVGGLVLNFAIGAFVVLTTYRVTRIEKTLKIIRKFLARHTNFNIDNLTDNEKREIESD